MRRQNAKRFNWRGADMPRGKIWSVNGSDFTRKQLEDRVKSIKARLTGGVQITSGDDDFEFMKELFLRHYPRLESRTIKPGRIMDLTVINNPESRWPTSSPTFFWIDVDGYLDNWNPADCWRNHNNGTLARQGFRRAIEDQCSAHYHKVCRAIRDELPLCPITGKPFDPRVAKNANVHHLDPQFSEILKGFLEITGIDIESVETVRIDGVKLADNALEIMFQEYHAIHARLIVVSKEGHNIDHYGGAA
jgi:hypothetical protein